jgi:hypothetical protein
MQPDARAEFVHRGEERLVPVLMQRERERVFLELNPECAKVPHGAARLGDGCFPLGKRVAATNPANRS